ncbi:tapasin-related protein isoform 1 precursor [Homo sapiens]|uniref:Tapasin-related protein n=2 Tax=Homo sapiens TaxID=9606 RepID=TPSNR_HUMAN|nr:tapasin-related protein isoform 1 precursor [Homo sapiens]Q9BX59.2 RecName: Full=Tapasin-related protein; Short=TAPASIN-R; AltName: Full=TAP-binding protein-like; AltName: Full=TAP-binding protein-related protein; Short=TAPBP-R; AltName: Full=Tapasin-like; Flags: Precursor [Homo sapiens]EAW88797.1 TAP binding protein-like, isoform CRA_a [Homo sapiens]|eukprot:NP_060479.3 tapasin-related protein precursor [Homo sapiens]
MGTQEGWCLLLCLALSGAAETKPHPAEGQWRAVDVVLDCFLAKDGAHRGALASSEDRARASLVLKQVPVLDDGSLEDFTDFQGGTLAQDDPPIIFEASVDLVQIPQAEALLHADCSGKEVTCEISRYFLQMTETTVKTAAWFMANMQVSGGGPSISLVMKTPRVTKNEALWHPTLNLPLSPQGTVRTAVEFQVMTQTQSLSFLLGSSASLDCGFSMAPGLDLISVEWRLQHKGRGQLVYSWTAGQGQAVRKGATLEPAQLGMARDASLTLPGLTIQDEGTYICQITTSLYRAQQIIQLNIQASPKVRLSLANEALLPTLICDIAGYYPLDVVVTWTREELGGSPAQVSGASFSSLRQSVAGTYSISSSLTAEPGSAGATYTCQVTHISLEEPLGASTQVVPPERRTALGVIFASSLFLLALMFLGLQRRQAPTGLGLLQAERWETTSCADTQSSHLHEDRTARVSQPS